MGDGKTSCVDPPKRKDAVGGLAVREQELSPEKNLGSQIELAFDAFFACVGRGLWLYSIDRFALEQLMAGCALVTGGGARRIREREEPLGRSKGALVGRIMRSWAVTRFPSYAVHCIS